MKPAILYVDDDPCMLEIFATYFRDQGYEVVPVVSGEQAMSQAAVQPFSLAVFDINLAEENGMELLSHFKTKFPALPVVMFTGLPDEDELVDEALARGASGFMNKKASLQELCEAVRSYLPGS